MALSKIQGLDWLVKEQANEDILAAAVQTSSALMAITSDADNITGTSDLAAVTPGTMMAALAALAFPIYSSATITSATPDTTRNVRSELTVTPSSSVAVGSNGSLAAIRGCTTLTTAKSITDGYLYGVQGKVVLDGATVVIGSDHIAGVYAQLSASGSTITSGHVAILTASGQNLPTSANVDGLYLESGGGKINSVIKSNVKATYFLDISDFESAGICASSGTCDAVTGHGWIKVYVAGAVRYIPLSDGVS